MRILTMFNFFNANSTHPPETGVVSSTPSTIIDKVKDYRYSGYCYNFLFTFTLNLGVYMRVVVVPLPAKHVYSYTSSVRDSLHWLYRCPGDGGTVVGAGLRHRESLLHRHRLGRHLRPLCPLSSVQLQLPTPR